MLKNLWQNIKTTLAGTFAGVPFIIAGVEQKNYSLVLSGIATLVLGLLAKDSTTK